MFFAQQEEEEEEEKESRVEQRHYIAISLGVASLLVVKKKLSFIFPL